MNEEVWKLETPEEDVASEELSITANRAIEGNTAEQEYLQKLWGESWDSIKKKLEAEGSTWYVWWMDGVREYMKQTREMEKE